MENQRHFSQEFIPCTFPDGSARVGENCLDKSFILAALEDLNLQMLIQRRPDLVAAEFPGVYGLPQDLHLFADRTLTGRQSMLFQPVSVESKSIPSPIRCLISLSHDLELSL